MVELNIFWYKFRKKDGEYKARYNNNDDDDAHNYNYKDPKKRRCKANRKKTYKAKLNDGTNVTMLFA